jgi:Xaa-Pro aminopeptidase
MEPIPDIPSEPAFPSEEYEIRLARLRGEMRRDGLDVLLVHQPPSVFYFSGYENLHVYDLECVAVPAEGDPTLVVPRIDESRAQLTSWVERIESVAGDAEAPVALARAVRAAGAAGGRVGVEKRVARAAGLSVHVYEGLRAELPRASIVDASGLAERVKVVKSPRELACLYMIDGEMNRVPVEDYDVLELDGWIEPS